MQIISSENNWLEGEAIRQLEMTASFEGMQHVVGMPDLHPGKGIPVGAAYLTENIFYPHLVGSDIGCGIGLWKTTIKTKKFKLAKGVKRLNQVASYSSEDIEYYRNKENMEKTTRETN